MAVLVEEITDSEVVRSGYENKYVTFSCQKRSDFIDWIELLAGSWRKPAATHRGMICHAGVAQHKGPGLQGQG
jgi:hypothetical protein